MQLSLGKFLSLFVVRARDRARLFTFLVLSLGRESLQGRIEVGRNHAIRPAQPHGTVAGTFQNKLVAVCVAGVNGPTC